MNVPYCSICVLPYSALHEFIFVSAYLCATQMIVTVNVLMHPIQLAIRLATVLKTWIRSLTKALSVHLVRQVSSVQMSVLQN
jgi:hypothetical protein